MVYIRQSFKLKQVCLKQSYYSDACTQVTECHARKGRAFSMSIEEELVKRLHIAESRLISSNMLNRMYETKIRKLEFLIETFKKRYPYEYELSVEETNQTKNLKKTSL